MHLLGVIRFIYFSCDPNFVINSERSQEGISSYYFLLLNTSFIFLAALSAPIIE